LSASTPKRVLIVEDRDSDARLILAELKSAGFQMSWTRVETETDYLAQLDPAPDLILADYNLPTFGAHRALRILRERGLDIPLIIVSGSIGEDLAVEAMLEGAADYLLKDRLGRMGQAVSQALTQKRLRDLKHDAEEALKVTETRLQQLVSTTPAVIYALQIEGSGYVPTWVSQSIERLTGFCEAEASSQEWWQAQVHPEDRERALDIMPALLADESCTVEYRFRCRDGSYRWVLDEKRLIRDAAGNPAEIVGSWLDITERKRLEEQFRQSQKMEAVGRLAGGIAHDFNNLLTVIMGYSEIALEGLRQGDPLRDAIEEIGKASTRAAALTRQLLAFSRRQMLVPAVVDFNALLFEIEKMLSRLIGEDVELTIRPAHGLWAVKVDPGQMEQVVMNLVINARDAMPRGGKLTIETANVELDESYVKLRPEAHAGGHVRVSVSDTGCGMDAATRARAFEPFFTTKSPDQGTGLGLATVYGIVTQSGGHIELYSEPELGTTFKIYIPRDRGGASPLEPRSGPATSVRGSETVFLVEDEAPVRSLARMVLESNGYHVLEADQPHAALQLFEQLGDPVQLLITDVVMPHMSGRQLAERLQPLRPEMKVLFVSGYTDDAVVRHGILDAGTPFLQKPFTPAALAQKVRAVLDK